MRTSIKAGMLYEQSNNASTEKQVVRIIGTRQDPANKQLTTVALIRCDKESTPWPTPFEWFEERVNRGEFIHIEEADNPAAPGIRCIEDLQDDTREAAFKNAVRDNTALIAPVLALGWAAFDLHERNKVLRQIAAGSVDGKRHSVRWLNLLLWRYWTGGALSLGPQYYRCGAYSRIELAEQIRAGKAPKTGHRAGRSVKVITSAMAARSHDRGGCYIGPFEEAVISSKISEYINDPLRKKEIELSLERRRMRMPWTPIQEFVVGCLSKMPDYRHLFPSVGQIRYIGRRNVDLLAVILKVMGKRYTALNHSPANGDNRNVALCAGHRYEIDPVLADIHLVDDLTRMPIGRPNIIFIVDTCSGLIAGVYVTVEEITFAHVARALHCAFSPKPEWCRATVGLEIGDHEWTAEGRCQHLAADNAHFLTEAARTIPELVSDVGICAAYRPDGKGQVETTAELANLGVIHLFRYGVTKGPKERAKEDPAWDARVSVQTFTRELVRWIINVANHRPLPNDRELDPDFVATGLDPTPFNVFKWSTSEHGGPPNAYDKHTWMPRLLERVKAKVTERGLEIGGLYFDLPNDEDFARMKAKATVGSVTYKPAHIDRITTRQIYLVPDDLKQPPQLIPLSEYSRSAGGLSFRETEIRHDYRYAQGKDAKYVQAPRKHDQTQAQAAATIADVTAVLDQHGSIADRNRKAKGTDLEEVKNAQAKRDNDKGTAEMHGADAPTGSAAEPTTTGSSMADAVSKPGKRPKLFS